MIALDEFLYRKFVVLMIYLTFIISISSMETDFSTSRIQRDTFEERQKLVSMYKIVSKTQCLLKMRSLDGYVHAKPITNLYDTKETNDGIFVFFPVAVNLFLIQHKESKRYLCGRNNQLFGLFQRNERECLFETKRSDLEFGQWDSYRLFYENTNHAFIRINTDLSTVRQNQTNFKSSKLIDDYRQLSIKYFTTIANNRTDPTKKTCCT